MIRGAEGQAAQADGVAGDQRRIERRAAAIAGGQAILDLGVRAFIRGPGDGGSTGGDTTGCDAADDWRGGVGSDRRGEREIA